MLDRTKGGPRKGAGLATDTGGAKTERRTVTLDAMTVSRMKGLGAGNLSRGIREAARRLAANARANLTDTESNHMNGTPDTPLPLPFSGIVPSVGAAVRWLSSDDDRAGFRGAIFRVDSHTEVCYSVVLVDLGLGGSVTNAAETICQAVLDGYLDGIDPEPQYTRWVYRDTAGRWDELIVERWVSGGVRVDFVPGYGEPWARHVALGGAREGKAVEVFERIAGHH